MQAKSTDLWEKIDSWKDAECFFPDVAAEWDCLGISGEITIWRYPSPISLARRADTSGGVPVVIDVVVDHERLYRYRGEWTCFVSNDIGFVRVHKLSR